MGTTSQPGWASECRWVSHITPGHQGGSRFANWRESCRAT
jgi:hypothetical protein